MSALCHLLFPALPGRLPPLPPPPPPPLCLFVCLADFLSFISCHPFPSEISHLCSQDDSMTDLIARGAAGKMFSLSLPRQQGLDALGSPQTYGAMSVPGRLQEGLRAGCFKCLRVGGAIGTPLHFQASARRPAPVALLRRPSVSSQCGPVANCTDLKASLFGLTGTPSLQGCRCCCCCVLLL